MTGMQFAFLYFGETANDLEQRVSELIGRGAEVRSASIAYGPPPAAGQPYSPKMSWHVLIVGEWRDGAPNDAA